MESMLISSARNQDDIWNNPVVLGEVLSNGKEVGKRLSEDTRMSKALTFDQSRNFKSAEQSRTIAVKKVPILRETLPVLYVSGSFYDVGFRIGRTFSSLIQQYVTCHRDVQLYSKLYETAKGKEVFNLCFNATSQMYPEHIREMRGIADGANIPFHKLFLLHMEDIMLVSQPSPQERQMPLTGSTTVIVTNEEQQFLGHVVDESNLALGNLYIVHVEITECCPPQEFSAVCIGGMLPGHIMGFNSNGLIFSVDPVPIRKPNECGIPRSIICRAILGATSYRKVEAVLRCEGYGIGNGLSVSVSMLHPRVLVRSFRCYEAGPLYPAHSNSTVSHVVIQPNKRTHHYHLNKFQHLNQVQEKLHDSYAKWILSRAKVLRGYDDGNPTCHITNILGDSSLSSPELSNIFTPVECQGMLSVAVGVFDFVAETLSLYLDNPREKSPALVLPLVAW